MDPITMTALVGLIPTAVNFISDWFGGDDKKKSRKTSYEQPLDYLQPHYQRAMDYANQLFQSGVGSEVYSGPRVASLSGQTLQNINNLNQLSTSLQNPFISGFMSSPLESIGNLRGMASGAQIGQNPHFQQALQNALGTASDLITSQVSGAGRYGSGAHTGVLADRLGQLSTQAMSSQYNKDVSNMLAANELMSNAQLGQMQTITGLGDLQGRTAMAALHGSGIIDQNKQAQIDAARQEWQERQMAPWQRLQNYMGAIQGLTGKFKQTNTTDYTGRDPWGTAHTFAKGIVAAEPWQWDIFNRKARIIRNSPQVRGALASGRGGLY